MSKTNLVTLIVTVLGAVKLVLNSFGVDLVTDTQINELANCVAGLVSVFGPVVMHLIHKKQVARAAITPVVQPVAPVVPQTAVTPVATTEVQK